MKTSKKEIEVDTSLRTNVPHIWAAGDVTGGLQFTHVAYEQGKIAEHNAFSRDLQRFELSAEKLANIIMPYPTLVEGVRWAADRLEQ